MNTMFENVSFIYMTEGEKLDKIKNGAKSALNGVKKGAGAVSDFFTGDFKSGNAKMRTYKDLKERQGGHANKEAKKKKNEAIKDYAKGGLKAGAAAGLTAAAIYAWYKKHKKNKGKKK